MRPLPPLARAQALAVVAFATLGEVVGSLVWGVYTYRLHNLPQFIPPAHGVVYLSGLAVAGLVRERIVVGVAAAGAIVWGIAGLTVLPRLDVAGAIGVPLLCLFLWRSRFRATYAGVFLVVGALELYGTSIGTWRWAAEASRPRHPGREPTERRRERIRLVRRDGRARRAVARRGRTYDLARTAMGPAFDRRERLMAPTTRRSHACPSSSASPSAAHSEPRRGTASTV